MQSFLGARNTAAILGAILTIAAIWMVENNEYLLIIKWSHVDVMSLSLGSLMA